MGEERIKEVIRGRGDITSAVGPFRMVSFDGTGVLACLSLFG